MARDICKRCSRFLPTAEDVARWKAHQEPIDIKGGLICWLHAEGVLLYGDEETGDVHLLRRRLAYERSEGRLRRCNDVVLNQMMGLRREAREGAIDDLERMVRSELADASRVVN